MLLMLNICSTNEHKNEQKVSQTKPMHLSSSKMIMINATIFHIEIDYFIH